MFDHVPREAREKSAGCIVCHAPRDSAALRFKQHRAIAEPRVLCEASASALWAGRGGVDPATGAALSGPSPHMAVEGGCVGCHGGGPSGIERGQSHGFRADRRRCVSCHDADRDLAWADERARIEKEARALWSDLFELRVLLPVQPASDEPTTAPPHATLRVQPNATQELGRAAFDLSLLLEDRGFLAHNLPYARMLLQKAKPVIERAARDHRRPTGGAQP
jgi:hypothetical protein